MVYIQHPSDPITWWSPDLILSRPDWLRGAKGRRRRPRARSDGCPCLIFWQVSADLALAFSTEPGHGAQLHGASASTAGRPSSSPEGWTLEKADRLREIALSGAMSQPFPAADG